MNSLSFRSENGSASMTFLNSVAIPAVDGLISAAMAVKSKTVMILIMSRRLLLLTPWSAALPSSVSTRWSLSA